jgi:hypothetical protein
MNSPAFLTLFSVIFILLGCYNVFTGFKRMREAQARGMPLKWYKQINILTGLEYILLALVFLISTSVRSNSLPGGLKGIVVPLYFILLLAAAILAGLVIRQGIINSRMLRNQSRSSSSTVKSNGANAADGHAEDQEDVQQRTANLERRRERRRNAAAARRRRAGKA